MRVTVNGEAVETQAPLRLQRLHLRAKLVAVQPTPATASTRNAERQPL